MTTRREILSGGVAAGALAATGDMEVFAQTEDGLVFETIVTDAGQTYDQSTGTVLSTYNAYTPMTEKQLSMDPLHMALPVRDTTPGLNIYLYNVPAGIFEPGERLVVTIERAVY